MKSTLEEVAKLAGVSRSTVSRVINEHPHVRSETRDKVWEAIQDSGYQPHAAARSLVTNRTQIIGLVIPEAVTTIFTDPFFPLLIRGIAGICNSREYHLMLSLFSGQTKRESLYRRVLRGGYVDGVIVASAMLEDPLLSRLLQDKMPFISVSRYPDEEVSYVDVDNAGGARMATEHLLRLGHQRIATITGPLGMMAGQERLKGYRQALTLRGLPVDEALIIEGDFTEDGGKAAMRQLLAKEPTAVFAASDMMAIGAMKAIKEAGLRVPDDVAVVGFDDLPLSSVVEPALTTVRQPIERMGTMSAEVLISLIEQETESPQHLVLPTQLVVRSSCGSP